MDDGVGKPAMRIADGGRHIGSLRQQRGDGGGIGAAGAMRVAGVDALAGEFDHLVAVEQQVDELAAGQMAALEQHPALIAVRQQFAQLFGGAAHVADRFGHGGFQQHAGFRQVGRDDRGQREQRFAQHGDGFVGEQLVAALGDHHRVEHQKRQTALFKAVGDRAHHAGVAEHADLGAGDRHVVEQRVELQFEEIIGWQVDAGDGACVLRGERGDDTAAVGTKRRKGFQVGQQAGATGGVDAGDGDDIGNGARLAGDRRVSDRKSGKNAAH